MSTVNMVSEEEAHGRVAEIYAEIKEALGTDFVPNLYKVMAVKPSFLETNWNKVQTKEIIAVAVSAVMGCEY